MQPRNLASCTAVGGLPRLFVAGVDRNTCCTYISLHTIVLRANCGLDTAPWGLERAGRYTVTIQIKQRVFPEIGRRKQLELPPNFTP